MQNVTRNTSEEEDIAGKTQSDSDRTLIWRSKSEEIW